MNRFENELFNGKFVVSECLNCNQVVWPVSDFCNICYNRTKWRDANNSGIIIEFSKKNDDFFGLIEVESNLRVMGKIDGNETPEVNQKVKLKECSFKETPKFIFEIVSN